MNYEQFRSEITEQLQDMPTDQLLHVLTVLDGVSLHYSITRSCTAMTVNNDPVPQIVRLHIAAKAIENRSKHTLDMRLGILKKFFETVRKPYDQVTTTDIRVYLYNYRTEHGVSESTLDRIRSNIRIFYTWVVDEGYMITNPAAKIGVIKSQTAEHEPLTALQLEIVRRTCHAPREKALVDVLYASACRVSELCALEIRDIDLDAQTIRIRHGKGDKCRISYLNAEAVISLRAYLATRSDDCSFVFVSDYKPTHGLTPWTIRLILNGIEKRTGMDLHLHPHKFRHTAATDALAHGMPVEQVQRFLGHSKIDTTLIYAKVNDSDVQASHRRAMA